MPQRAKDMPPDGSTKEHERRAGSIWQTLYAKVVPKLRAPLRGVTFNVQTIQKNLEHKIGLRGNAEEGEET